MASTLRLPVAVAVTRSTLACRRLRAAPCAGADVFKAGEN
jgi:hypothetical protein